MLFYGVCNSPGFVSNKRQHCHIEIGEGDWQKWAVVPGENKQSVSTVLARIVDGLKSYSEIVNHRRKREIKNCYFIEDNAINSRYVELDSSRPSQ